MFDCFGIGNDYPKPWTFTPMNGSFRSHLRINLVGIIPTRQTRIPLKAENYILYIHDARHLINKVIKATFTCSPHNQPDSLNL
jgi:hypothetical protein